MKKNKFIESLNILDGIILYNDFDIDPKLSFKEQEYSFKEDILQIRFGDRFIVDVGWRPEFDSAGYFVIKAIQDNDWLNPVLKSKCKNLNKLKKIIEKTSRVISALKERKDLPYRHIEYDTYE